MNINKRMFFLAIALCFVITLHSQNNQYYYANGTPHYWQENFSSANIIVRNHNHYDSIAARLQTIFTAQDDEVISDEDDSNIIVNSSSLVSRDKESLIATISLSDNDIAFFSYAKQIGNNKIWLTNEVYVKLKDSIFYATHILPTLSQYSGVEVYYEGMNEYRIVCETDNQVSSIANQLYDTTYVVYSTPDFYCEATLCSNDTYYNNQWALKNTGQQYGTSGVDIKAEEAWNFLQRATGDLGSNIKVAVIDEGVEEHEDFYLNGGVSKVLEGYTANGHGTGRPRPNNKHGECCAGIIAAVHNNIGVAGIATNARIVPIRIFQNKTDPSGNCYLFKSKYVARAIKKAWDDFQCPILNNSWESTEPNDMITDAINYCATEGRGGKGCFVAFASGNGSDEDYHAPVSYPGYLECVMAVGAMNNRAERVIASNHSTELAVVAPGLSIYTTDRRIGFGYNPRSNYYSDFSGTSAACAHVSGVAALMLSVNPNLTRQEMTHIIKRTAQKLGNYNYQIQNNNPEMTWNEEVGYGMIDAHKAVVQSFLFGREITLTGLESISNNPCGQYQYILNIYHPELFSYQWTCSSNLSIVFTNENIAIIKANALGSGFLRTEIYSEGRLIETREITIFVNNEFSSFGTNDFTINTNTIWSGDHLLQSKATVASNTTLTITGNIACTEDASIVVSPGARLIIDGGHLHGVCDGSQWNGIEVRGDMSRHQFLESGQYWQGYIELKNNAVIEDAIVAILVGNATNSNMSGGIVKATNAQFINNGRAVQFKPYENQYMHNGNEIICDNVSSFRDCSFEIMSSYEGPTEFEYHVGLHSVRGVKFNHCDFTFNENQHSSDYPYGIYAWDGGFSVNGICTSLNIYPCIGYDPSSFRGFNKAIVAVMSGGQGLRPITVKNTEFRNNDFGIYFRNISFVTVLNSDFEIGRKTYGCATGIFGIGTPNIVIEQNSFRKGAVCSAENYGIVLRNTASQNLIYKNTFEGLYCANVAAQLNHVSGDLKHGLEYRCNDNVRNTFDFFVTRESEPLGENGIQKNQGSVNVAAANTFSANATGHFLNYGDYIVNYYYDPSRPNEIPSTIYGVTLVQTTNEEGCPSHYGNGGNSFNDDDTPVLSDNQRSQRETDYLNAFTIYSNLKNAYDGQIDGGDTDNELSDIRHAQSENLWELRTQLLGHSPYLSEDVLRATADRDDVFPESVLFEILAANPDELKNETLMSYLENKTNPLPEYMINILRQIANGTTSRTAMESEMARYAHKYSDAAGDIVRSILNDSVADVNDLIGWLGNMKDLSADRDIVSLFMAQGDYTSAMSLANMMPTLYHLQGSQLTDHNDYMTLLSLYNTLTVSNRSLSELTEQEWSQVENIALYGTGYSQSMAQGIIDSANGDRNDYCPTDIEIMNSGRRDFCVPPREMNEALGMTVTATPNPASNWVAFDYTLPVGTQDAMITINDMLGRTVKTINIDAKLQQKVVDLRDIPNGIYSYTLRCGELVQTNKIVINR